MHGQGWRLILEDRIDIDQITNGLDALEHAGRYNPPPVLAGQENAFKVVYFSGSVRTAHREIEGRADVKSHALAEFEYTLQDDALLDLTDEEIRNQLNITLDDLLEEWASYQCKWQTLYNSKSWDGSLC